MAIVIKGKMPKACNWFDENGKQHFCEVNAFCDCEVFTRGERPSDCPIIGEIPDKHGRLIDADVLNKELAEHSYPSERGWYYAEVGQFIDEAPTVLEASVNKDDDHSYEMQSDMRDYCERYEPTYNPEDGSM